MKLLVGLRETIWNPLGLAFKAGKRLALVSVPSKRDAKAGNSQVLKRIGIDHLGKLAMDNQVLGWIGMATLILGRMVMTKSYRR